MEARIRASIASIEGHRHVYPWVMRHAGYLCNRFSVNPRGATSYELMHGRAFRGQLVLLGEQVLYYRPTKRRGDLRWCRGTWLGVKEWGTPDRNGREDPRSDEGAALVVHGPWEAQETALHRGGCNESSLLPDSSGTPAPPSRPGPGPDEAASTLPQAQVRAVAEEVTKTTANRHENQADHRRYHNSDFKHKGVTTANRHENRPDYRRNRDSDFKHKGAKLAWMSVGVVGSQGKGQRRQESWHRRSLPE